MILLRFPYLICLWILVFSLYGQKIDRRKKPVLIRADRAEEKIEESSFVPNPFEAKKHLEVGDFYYKRDNYKAAENRYREAIKHSPKWAKAYQKLVDVLETKQAYSEAIEVCLLFTETNPSSRELKEFQKRVQKLKIAVNQ